jgi:hypothetical protein
MTPLRRRIVRVLASILFALFALVVVTIVVLRHPLPPARTGDADALAHRMLAAVDHTAWTHTGAVRWTFFDGNRHLWDRTRNFERFDHGDLRVFLDLSTRRGVATRKGTRLHGEELTRALEQAWARWCNDSFWLNPVSKVFDEGVTRSLATDDHGREALLLTYSSGGVTPGDRYLWILDDHGRPTAWRMWVSVLPVAGLEASWTGWKRLATGAWIATEHQIGPVKPHLREVVAAETLTSLEPGPDPFGPLVSP